MLKQALDLEGHCSYVQRKTNLRLDLKLPHVLVPSIVKPLPYFRILGAVFIYRRLSNVPS